MEINNKVLDEKVKHLKKAIEILGGNEYLNSIKNDDELLERILISLFSKEEGKLNINNKSLSVNAILSEKIDYEKNYIKTKKKYTEKIVYKIKSYNSSLETLIRKFKNTNSIELYREIKKEINLRYRMDIDNYILSKIDNLSDDNSKYYGEYLNSKKDDFINTIINILI